MFIDPDLYGLTNSTVLLSSDSVVTSLSSTRPGPLRDDSRERPTNPLNLHVKYKEQYFLLTFTRPRNWLRAT